jgi:F-type H+-transporting ATPase subunit delta
MERATLARPYADAIAKLAGEENAWAQWSERLALLAAVAGDAQIQALASTPSADRAGIARVVLDVCGEQLGVEGGNLVQLLVENKRLALAPEIADLFEAQRAAHEGELNALITSAYELSATQMASLVAKLEARFGRKINATQSADADLIGGVVIQVGDEVMDASVRGGLLGLDATLKA